jgi:5-formyltetrahydrofolate cyclo-ligase
VVRPDILLVPLLGFDAACNRIGQGQGHYDRTLQALRAQGPVVAIGLAFEAQRVEAVPVEPHDQPLDFIVTPDGAYRRP